MANHTQLPYCTVQRKHGDFCDAPSVEDAPFPICQAHVDRLLKHYQQEPLELGREMMQRFTEQMDLRRPEYSAAALEAMRLNEAQALVYYATVSSVHPWSRQSSVRPTSSPNPRRPARDPMVRMRAALPRQPMRRLPARRQTATTESDVRRGCRAGQLLLR